MHPDVASIADHPVHCKQQRSYEAVMKKVIFAVLLMALALFLIVPNSSWAF